MNMECNFPIISDWCFSSDKRGYFLMGKVSGNPLFHEGEMIRTSYIKKIGSFGANGRVVVTQNNSYLIFKDEVNYKYHKNYPNYWRNIYNGTY